jgi:hypothetical protein
MAGVFEIQGFGFKSDWNGEFRTGAAQSAMQGLAATEANAISISPRLFIANRSSNDVIAGIRNTAPNRMPKPAAIEIIHASVSSAM